MKKVFLIAFICLALILVASFVFAQDASTTTIPNNVPTATQQKPSKPGLLKNMNQNIKNGLKNIKKFTTKPVTTSKPKVNVDVACVQDAVKVRETALVAAFKSNSEKMIKAHEDRLAALINA